MNQHYITLRKGEDGIRPSRIETDATLVGRLFDSGEIAGCMLGFDLTKALEKFGGKFFNMTINDLPWDMIEGNTGLRAKYALSRYFKREDVNVLEVYRLFIDAANSRKLPSIGYYKAGLYEATQRVLSEVGLELPEGLYKDE